MQRFLLCLLALAGGMLVNVILDLRAQNARAGADPTPPAVPGQPTLSQLVEGKLEVLDLAWPLNNKTAFWPGENYKPFELHTIATLEKDGVLSKAFASPEHLGTHLDAPNHFEPNRPAVSEIAPGDLFAPGVLLDVSAQVAGDADYRVSVDDIEAFEAAHGPIPSGAVVLVYTGWSRFWDNLPRYQNKDVMNVLHFPGFSAEAVSYLVQRRQVRGVGLDTMSVDHGPSRDYPVHHLLGKSSRYGLENLANLNKLPPSGFYLFVAPMKIESGTGGPARIFAIWSQPTDAP